MAEAMTLIVVGHLGVILLSPPHNTQIVHSYQLVITSVPMAQMLCGPIGPPHFQVQNCYDTCTVLRSSF